MQEKFDFNFPKCTVRKNSFTNIFMFKNSTLIMSPWNLLLLDGKYHQT